MAVFIEAGRGRRKWEARKSISGTVRGSPGRAIQAGIRGIELKSLALSTGEPITSAVGVDRLITETQSR